MPHLHIAERCIHSDTKRTLCDHKVLWSSYRVREVQCDPSFCQVARCAQDQEAQNQGR